MILFIKYFYALYDNLKPLPIGISLSLNIIFRLFLFCLGFLQTLLLSFHFLTYSLLCPFLFCLLLHPFCFFDKNILRRILAFPILIVREIVTDDLVLELQLYLTLHEYLFNLSFCRSNDKSPSWILSAVLFYKLTFVVKNHETFPKMLYAVEIHVWFIVKIALYCDAYLFEAGHVHEVQHRSNFGAEKDHAAPQLLGTNWM